SGKSTLLRLINGLETVDTGTVTVANKDVTALKGKAMREFRKNISMIFQQFNLLNNITVEENILLPLKLHRRSEEHTSELQSRFDLVCRLLLEKKKKKSY